MPTIEKNDLVLVTGASGFIAAHTAREFLKQGFRVRGTVRSREKGEYLRNLFEGLGQFEYVIVDDITKDGVFDEAIKGIDAVAHLASPFHTNVKDPKELIDPAVKGTTGVLKAVQKNNPKIKRVVITSSVAAVEDFASPGPRRLTEDDWNTTSVDHVKEKGVDSNPLHAYQASKALAEKALWEFIETEKPSWDAAAINPPWVLGEVIHEVSDPAKINTSVGAFYEWVAGGKTEKDLPGPLGNFVNVKDVALAHVLALTTPAASGQRFITSAGPLAAQAWVDIIHKDFPQIKNVPVGKPGTADEVNKQQLIYDGSKASKVLGIKYKNLEETTVEMFESLEKKFGKI
ncbi:hypothetical protein IAT38_004743 [Cryptococcus sp. DSM 104549]